VWRPGVRAARLGGHAGRARELGWALGRRRTDFASLREETLVPADELRRDDRRGVDFDRDHSGMVRLVLGAVNLTTRTETFFDNDRHVLGLDHVLAGTRLPGLPPVTIGRQMFGPARSRFRSG